MTTNTEQSQYEREIENSVETDFEGSKTYRVHVEAAKRVIQKVYDRLVEAERERDELKKHLAEYIQLIDAPHHFASLSEQVDSGYVDAMANWEEKTREVLK